MKHNRLRRSRARSTSTNVSSVADGYKANSTAFLKLPGGLTGSPPSYCSNNQTVCKYRATRYREMSHECNVIGVELVRDVTAAFNSTLFSKMFRTFSNALQPF